MIARAALLSLLVGIAGCGQGPRTALDRCEAQADSTPAVQEQEAISAGHLDYQWQHGPAIRAIRTAAVNQCLHGSGARFRGGVERPN